MAIFPVENGACCALVVNVQRRPYYVEKTALNAAFSQDGHHLQPVSFRIVGDADTFIHVMAEYGLQTRLADCKPTYQTVTLEPGEHSNAQT
jgi:hypothetical protein